MSCFVHVPCLVSEPEDHWAPKIDKKGIRLDVKKLKDSALVVVRCTMMVKASYEKVLGMAAAKPCSHRGAVARGCM